MLWTLVCSGCFADTGVYDSNLEGSSPDATTIGASSDGADTDLASDSGSNEDGADTTSGEASESGSADDTDSGTGADAVCDAGQVLGCEGDDLVRCTDDGTSTTRTSCDLGCNPEALRCNDVDPSNGLGEFLDGAELEADYDFTSTATIDTDSGAVLVGGEEVTVPSSLVGPSEGGDGPQVRVLVVGSLTTNDVVVTGIHALAIVSHGEIRISGHVSASARSGTAGPGAWSEPGCEGQSGEYEAHTIAGAGGGGFGSPGARGGSATNQGTALAGLGGDTVGSATLIPLRGGCDSGAYGADLRGRGGGAIALVSRTAVAIEGIISANGSSDSGGGSGGGILIEAPTVQISGNVVANGGAGAGGGFLGPIRGEDGRTDDLPAQGGSGADTNCGNGGNGAAGSSGATPGQNIAQSNLVFAGHGGGGVGRIRINALEGGVMQTGIVSPNPTTGSLGIR